MNRDGALAQPSTVRLHVSANGALKAAAQAWFLATFVGQWIFLYYVAVLYVTPTVQGNFPAWDRNPGLLHGYVAGDPAGNFFFGAHMLFAAAITAAGILQLIPYIRKHAAWFHRWNGRLFLTTTLLISLGGWYLVLVRRSNPTVAGTIGITLNGALMFVFAIVAWRHIRARRIAAHRRWALRTFMVVNGVWFFRVGLMAWLILTNGLGSTERFDGPFDKIWAFANYLFPWMVLEFYLLAQDRAGDRGKWLMAGGLVALTLVMCVGIYGAYTYLWSPFL